MAVQPPTSFLTSQSFGGSVADLPGVSGVALGEAALRPEDRSEGSIEISVEQGRFRFDEGLKVVEEVPRHAVDKKPPERDSSAEFDKESVLNGFGVRVGRNDFPEELVRLALRLLVVCVRHRVNKPSLSV